MTEIITQSEKDGARRRNDATGQNQCLVGVQPSGLTDSGPPSPVGLASNLLARTKGYDPSSTLPRSRKLSDTNVCNLYFLAGAGLIKIGITTNLTSRIRSIRNSSPAPLVLLATGAGCTLWEGFAHSRFRHLRRHGEWFEDEGSIRDYILDLAKAPYRKIVIPDGSPLRAFGPCLGGAA